MIIGGALVTVERVRVLKCAAGEKRPPMNVRSGGYGRFGMSVDAPRIDRPRAVLDVRRS
jgi:hypothetical protein